MGISLGGGFLASLALPVAAYIILHIIGAVGYGMYNIYIKTVELY